MAIVERDDYQVTDPNPPYAQATLWFSYDDADGDIQEVWCDNPTTMTARLTVRRSNGTGPASRSIDWPPGDTTRYPVGQGTQNRYRLTVGNGGKLVGIDLEFTLV